ncbi:hypothetical protein EVB32_151 [Rhizobium phage RHph_TM39]|uniref:Uncharacterized protein n=1 Tax=Rhizobium phage RHph_TM30 TaxID=2509764 RepID=A0A7S5UXI9_9CAUD|nr:hypothetical protein PQC16_gp151 [Rhizobium phage RHph_TM30]QIG71258.1 hypothetical protein EVB93_151 [Rhizobium phage RHph_TM30]QIG71984.1 hypothetical protein EVB95_150 [Rhizobium phage RHph_TM2_3B]QIG77139.1 hypothetical protein EVB32_151 [Rhizobium phage RHph_TM39]
MSDRFVALRHVLNAMINNESTDWCVSERSANTAMKLIDVLEFANAEAPLILPEDGLVVLTYTDRTKKYFIRCDEDIDIQVLEKSNVRSN